MKLEGSAGNPPGHVTVEMAKNHCFQNPVIEVSNYHGRIALGPAMFYPGGINPAQIVHSGDQPFSFILMATMAYEVTPTFQMDKSAKLVLLGNAGKGMGENAAPAGTMQEAAEALDDLRRLGALDLAVNHPKNAPRQ